eukprot:CAMPEP_0194038002 /NCGR_PEP_ID=MMETSP0009_2-20130614/10280_1 /TAXON_ID=210454 /ORGANISM="Grammatophora oceanica, Strain CCMP 410" /LENGTH=224 /DNA_ID=CAMNT_0038680355 /DNA_START=140 /DNA_END=814 /DNA_ORIENTATION=+
MVQFAACLMVFNILAGVTGLDGGKPGMKQMKVEECRSKDHPRVFFDISIGGKKAGRIVMELFETKVPMTAENFRALCTGEKGNGRSGKPRHYKGTKFFAISPGYLAQGGDTTNNDGTGGESIYGIKFEDEWTRGYIPHSEPYLLTSANSGPNKNASQFYLTLDKTPWLNEKNVVFGCVESGKDVVRAMEKVGSKEEGKTSEDVVIVDCGELPKKKNSKSKKKKN